MSVDKQVQTPSGEVQPSVCSVDTEDTKTGPKHNRAMENLNLLFNGVIAVTAVIGTVFVVCNLQELKMQNSQDEI